MTTSSFVSYDGLSLYDGEGRKFDPVKREWRAGGYTVPEDMRRLALEEAVAWLQKESGSPIRPPVAVIGPREASLEQIATAHQLGKDLAVMGLTVLCGGRQGVMEAVCRGVAEKGGVSVGLLPDGDWMAANPYVTVPIATGIGIARNALISRAAFSVIAVGGGLGTLSEIALSLQFEKQVFTMCGAPHVDGAQSFPGWEAMKPYFCAALLALSPDL